MKVRIITLLLIATIIVVAVGIYLYQQNDEIVIEKFSVSEYQLIIEKYPSNKMVEPIENEHDAIENTKILFKDMYGEKILKDYKTVF